MAKKPSARSETRCDQGGPEFTPLFIPIHQSDRVMLEITLCKSAFVVHVFYGGEKIFEATSNELPDDVARVVLPQKPVGTYALNWGYLPVTDEWQTRSEVIVEGAARFRQRKSNESSHATNHSFVYIEVMA